RTNDVQPAARGLASDNQASVHTEIHAALAACNYGHQPAYGADEATGRLRAVVRRHLRDHAEVYPVVNGTGPNVVSLQAISEPWSSGICPETAHVNTDECGAAEKVAGLKLVPVPAPDGKLTPEQIEAHASDLDDVHRRRPAGVSITQS